MPSPAIAQNGATSVINEQHMETCSLAVGGDNCSQCRIVMSYCILPHQPPLQCTIQIQQLSGCCCALQLSMSQVMLWHYVCSHVETYAQKLCVHVILCDRIFAHPPMSIPQKLSSWYRQCMARLESDRRALARGRREGILSVCL